MKTTNTESAKHITTEATIPMIAAAQIGTQSQPAVIPTKPAKMTCASASNTVIDAVQFHGSHTRLYSANQE